MYQSCYNSHITFDKYILYVEQTVANIAPQRKKEIERYGEREKLYFCLVTSDSEIGQFSGRPSWKPPSHRLSPLPVSLSHHLHPYTAVSLSFSVVSYGHTQYRSVRLSKNKIIVVKTLFQNQNTNQKILNPIDPMTDSQDCLGLCETGLLFFLSLTSMLLQSSSS